MIAEWIKTYLDIAPLKLMEAGYQTLFMLSVSLLIGALLGIPLGVFLVLTKKGGALQSTWANSVLNYVINIVRSIPFVILLALIMPITKAIVHTTIGTKAALVPLVFYIVPYLARLVESSLLEVGDGIIETAEAMGANTFQIIWHFLLPEAKSSLVLAMTTGTIGLLGVTAMAGTIGGGGIGDLALTYGYQRFNTPLMVATVIVLIIFVQLIQGAGNLISKKLRHSGR